MLFKQSKCIVRIRSVNIPDLDFKHLMVFQALMAKRQVSLVAEEIGQSQPAVSRSLARLRKHFGDPLFVRTRQSMEPTPCAREVAPAIDEMLDLYYERLSQNRHFDPLTSARTFRIAASEVGHALMFPRLLQDICKPPSRIRLKAVPLGLHSLLNELETGKPISRSARFPSSTPAYTSDRCFRNTTCASREKTIRSTRPA